MNKDLKIVIGLGKTGFSCIQYLARKGYNLAVVDSRLDPPELQKLKKTFPKIPTYLGKLDENILSSAKEIIVSPGVAVSEPTIAACIKRGIKVIGDIELFVKEAKAPIIAITGSNGKSTVTTLLGEMIKKSGKKVGVGGNLGTPALELLDQAVDFYVLELSSFQLETTSSLNAKAAVILNISPDHMDRYKNLNDYLKIKQRIYTNCHAAIINRDDPLTYANIKLPQKIISFGTDQPRAENFGINNGFLMYGNEKLTPITELKIKGRHNISNALAALALGTSIGIPPTKMLLALRNFQGLPHRSEWLVKINGVDWYNDSKATNVGATKAAIEGLGSGINGKIILIAGGLSKNNDFSLLRNVIVKYVRAVILIGKDAILIEKALNNIDTEILHASSMKEAVEISAQKSLPKDAVLLSPACASFDMFDNFEHRGEIFAKEVNKIMGSDPL